MKTGNYCIDNATVEDYARLVDIWASSVKATHHFLSEEDFNFYKDLLPGFLSQVSLKCLKYESGEIVGFAGTINENLEMLFIAAAERGNGWGKRLLLYAVEHSGVTKVDVNRQNIQAVLFYEHFGFKTKSISASDGFGKPYPILHMELPKKVKNKP